MPTSPSSQTTPTIEKGVPIPEKAKFGKAGYPCSQVASSLQVGDSVFFPGASYKTGEYLSVTRAIKLRGGKSTARKVDGGIRIWRIA